MSQLQEKVGPQVRHNLPVSLSEMIGREHEMDVLTELLQQDGVRLVTLTGPGGSGKTRLALETARRLLSRFPEGVFFVSLAPLQDPDLLPAAIAGVLQIPERGAEQLVETLKTALAASGPLLVLDNFEHLMDAAPVVSELLSAAPRLRVLVTSRESLRLRGERHFAVNPLTAPSASQIQQGLTPEQASGFPAVALFRQRARALRPSFELTGENSVAVAEICARLDGLPLAIELAAARLPLFGTPQALYNRLESGLRLLTSGARDMPARQKALRATMQWSYDLLTPDEQRLFRRLAVFVGGRTLDAIEKVCVADDTLDIDILDVLEALLDKSLLLREEGPDGEPRFVMLQTIHEFAREQLEASDELDEIYRLHSDYFLAMAEEAEQFLMGPEQTYWLERLEAEDQNFRQALQWFVHTLRLELAARLAVALSRFWYVRGHASEGRHRLQTILQAARSAIAPVLEAKLLRGAAILASVQGDHESAATYLDECLQIARQINDRDLLMRTLLSRGIISAETGENEEALTYLEQSLKIAEELNEPHTVGSTLNSLGAISAAESNYRAARAYYKRSLQVAEESGNTRLIAIVMGNLGEIEREHGDREQAQNHLERNLLSAVEIGDKGEIANAITRIALLSRESANHLKAARLMGAAGQLRVDIDATVPPVDAESYDEYHAYLRRVLGAETFEKAFIEGRAMSLQESISLALQEMPATDNRTRPPSTGLAVDHPAGLTPRELEVLGLVAQGMTDAEVADALVISPRTVNAHLTSVYGKLGVNSRTAASLLAVQNGWV